MRWALARSSPYEVLTPLGAGGMGEVYRVRDARLGRDIAVKVLPDEVARDSERLARFKREAHVLASLNHANVAAIYGLEESDGRPFLVLELVEGETLQERNARGPISVDEALPIALQIAEALGGGPRARHRLPGPEAGEREVDGREQGL